MIMSLILPYLNYIYIYNFIKSIGHMRMQLVVAII